MSITPEQLGAMLTKNPDLANPNRNAKVAKREYRKPTITQIDGPVESKADVQSERELQNLIENWFRINGIPAFRQRMDKKSNMPRGTPDFLVCYKGRFIALECKVGNNEPTKEQEACLAFIHANGGTCEVVRSLPHVKDLLNED